MKRIVFAFQTNELEVAIYDCRWYDAPIRFRKLMITFLIMCKRPIVIHAKPFYELNLEQLSSVGGGGYPQTEVESKQSHLSLQITKSIYIMITLAMQLLASR